MKKFLIPVITATMIAFASCGDDECDHNLGQTDPVASLDVAGNWYEEAMNEEMRFNENGTFYDRYSNPTRSEEIEGRWEYDRDNQKLTYTYSFLGQTQFVDWTVEELTEMSLTLSSTTVAEHKVERIVETYNLEVGGSADIQFSSAYPSYTVSSYTSNNERLASVTDDGKIVAEGEKGTTYIKIATNKGNVWVRVTVGDDCLDLWYDYVSLMGVDYAAMTNILGEPAVSGPDGYSFAYALELSDVASELDVFLNTATGLVDEMILALKSNVPEVQILSYMDSHYYPYDGLGYEHCYTTCPEVENSLAIVRYDKENNCIRFLNPSYWIWPDYTGTFGLTTEQIVERFGDLYYGVLPYYLVSNVYVETIYFTIDETTGKVTAYQLGVRSSVKTQDVLKLLSAQYNLYQTDETNTMFAFRDNETQENSKIMVVYDTVNSVVIYYDLENYRVSNTAAKNEFAMRIVKSIEPFIKK